MAAVALLLCSAPLCAPAQEAGSGPPPGGGSPIRLERWDDDWSYPEGSIRMLGQRWSLFAGAAVTRFADGRARSSFGARQIDPVVDLYRPGPKGLFTSFDLFYTGLARTGHKARFIALTLGRRAQFVTPDPSRWVVPFASLHAGPYFVKTSDAGSQTVLGANATVGVELKRRLIASARYDFVPETRGQKLSAWSFSLSLKVPLRTPSDAAAKRRRPLVPPGRLVDIGGRRLHLVCSGQGNPTVVLEAGLSDAWVTWTKVQSELSRTTRVCSYDRAGIGFSDPGPPPRTSARIAEELHELLHAGAIEGPYVLVGHSFGGYNARLFASRFPSEVVGMVLVDASHEDQLQRSPEEVRTRTAAWANGLPALVERAERGEPVPPIVPNLPAELAARPAWYRTMYEEWSSLEESASELRSADRSLDVPLVVVTAGRSRFPGSRAAREQMRRAWDEMQSELASLSPRGQRVVAKRSGHYVHRDQPEVVVQAVRDVIAAGRSDARR